MIDTSYDLTAIAEDYVSTQNRGSKVEKLPDETQPLLISTSNELTIESLTAMHGIDLEDELAKALQTEIEKELASKAISLVDICRQLSTSVVTKLDAKPTEGQLRCVDSSTGIEDEFKPTNIGDKLKGWTSAKWIGVHRPSEQVGKPFQDRSRRHESDSNHALSPLAAWKPRAARTA